MTFNSSSLFDVAMIQFGASHSTVVSDVKIASAAKATQGLLR